jgi:glycerophosphoryl diester phosphodiesterase
MTTKTQATLRRQPNQPPLIIAHRGASGLSPENTLAAFRKAVEIGAPAIECDVHLTADGVPIVIHDDSVDRTTDGSGKVSAFTSAALRRLDAGAWYGAPFAGERVPLLRETLQLCAGKARLFVELKKGGGQALASAALVELDQAAQTDLAVISFDPELVEIIAQRRPDLPVGFLLGSVQVTLHGADAAVQAARRIGASFISPQHNAVDERIIAASHRADLPVSVWTVDDPGRMRQLADLGVDAITTNRPDLALALFQPPG